jgi:EAL domain-containing protein (putative c-di-GMP-specific phosphodiesterase class I)
MDLTMPQHLVGFAFAGSDLVFEVTADGLIDLALGAAERLTGRKEEDLRGLNWTALFGPGEAELLETLSECVGPGERQGPLRVALARPGKIDRHISLSVFRMPIPGAALSCALSLGAAPQVAVESSPEGLLAVSDFTAAAGELLAEAESAGLSVRLDLIELTGFGGRLSELDPEVAAGMRRRLAATLRANSLGGLGGAEIAQDRYAILSSGVARPDRLETDLGRATGSLVAPAVAHLPLEAGAQAQNLRAMRYVLDRFIEDGPDAAATGFKAAVQRMVRDSARFRTQVAAGTFQLAYQPVVNLADGSLHHFEALARFETDASPADTIRLAEELNMIADFDLAVVSTVLSALEAEPATCRVAVNLSARSLALPRFLSAFDALIVSRHALRPRLLLEITETQAIENLEVANGVIQRLRSQGHVVCLDDFGAGAASLDYLRRLDIDIVKVDGRYIQALRRGSRDAVLLKHIVALCSDLGIVTIAEMVETRDTAELVHDLGVALGQGWHFAKPLSKPQWRATTPPPPAKRVGMVEGWR